MTKIIVTFCEGPHDISFLTRLLKTACYKTFHDIRIKEYPTPLNGILKGSLLNEAKFVELKIDQLSSVLIPKKILKKDDRIVLLYAIGGNRQYARTKDIIDKFIDTHSSSVVSGDEIAGFAGIEQSDISFIFFNDADKSFNEEVKKVNTFLKEYFHDNSFNVEHNNYVDFKDLKYGLYLFSKDGNMGNLEDHLMELMITGNEDIFNDAKEYYDKHFSDVRLMRKKIQCSNQIPTVVNDKVQTIYQNKSLITIAGQLQNSGASQNVTIDYSDYLTLDKIQKSDIAQEIINFIERA